MRSFRTSDGRTLAYRREGAGSVLVCHPGGPGASSRYLRDLGGLARWVTLVCLDPRGTGWSDTPRDPSAYTLDHYVGDLDELRAQLGLGRMALLGFSHGGMVSIRYAATYPDRVERLVLANTSARRGEAQRAEAEHQIAARAGEPWHAEALAALESAQRADQTVEAMTRLLKTMAPLFFARWSSAASEFVESDFGIDNVDALRFFNARPPDVTSDLGRISSPTLVITGEQDFVCGPASGGELAEGIAGARLVVIPDAGHMTYFEQPERFVVEVLTFLRG